jgi:hypothetical protein
MANSMASGTTVRDLKPFQFFAIVLPPLLRHRRRGTASGVRLAAKGSVPLFQRIRSDR